MNLLFVNYGQADNNSAYHILGHARALAARGHDVCVGVAKSVPDGAYEPNDGFRIASHRTILKLGTHFADGRPVDVLHVWTPRETTRQFVMKFEQAWHFRAMVIHLEDNETAIFQRFTGRSIEEAARVDQEWPKGLIHPTRHRAFLDSAQGITIVHRCLEALVPALLPRQELPPIMDFDFFSKGNSHEPLRSELGIPPEARVIVFNGNDHAATALDNRQLYEAVELLIERGRDIVFVRTGHVLPANYEGLQFRPGPHCIEFGFIERTRVPQVMRLADVVIQPGDADVFNAFRLPAKVPEYLSMGKPLIVGTANIGGELAELRAACVLPRMSPEAMANAVEESLDAPADAQALGARGRAFALRRFDEDTLVSGLEAFYQRCLDGR